MTAFSQLVPMQADSALSIFFGVTVGHRLAVVQLNGGCFNVIDLFKYVHKVIVSGSNVFILHSSSASGVMLIDLIRIVFVDVDANRVAFPLYSYRLHAAIVSLQRYGKLKIKKKKENQGHKLASSIPRQQVITPSSPVRSAPPSARQASTCRCRKCFHAEL